MIFRGFLGLLEKEVMRFYRVAFQTLFAPVLSTILYLFIFSHVLGSHVRVYDGVSYVAFLTPGLIMMSVLQNAFSNSSSSLIQSKVTGNIVLVLLPPISSLTFFLSYAIAGVVRGVAVGIGVLVAAFLFEPSMSIYSLLWILAFAISGGMMSASLGIIAGLWAEKFDQVALFTNFIIMPLTFLSGVFYSIHSLPDLWHDLTRLNPFFYMIDGFRYGFFQTSDISPYLSLTVTLFFTTLLSALAYRLIDKGYKLRT